MKRACTLAAILCMCAGAWAYNPPFGGESIFSFADPELLSGGASATGGPLNVVVPASIVFNPAQTALSQRTAVNVSYAVGFDTATDSLWAHIVQLGLVVPTKWCVLAGTVQGTFADMTRMQLGDSIILHAGASKDITEKLSVGANLYTGFYFAHGSDFTIGADLGFVYSLGDRGILKDARVGGALLNLGKPLSSSYDVQGIDGSSAGVSYPSVLTPRASFAATLFEADGFSGSFSTDLSAPFFQNLVLDAAVGFAYRGIAQLSVGWSMNVRELVHGGVSLPSVGLRIRFAINSSKISSKNEDWAQSEMGPSVAWQNLYGGINVISAGVHLDLGLADTSAPEIILWNGEE